MSAPADGEDGVTDPGSPEPAGAPEDGPVRRGRRSGASSAASRQARRPASDDPPPAGSWSPPSLPLADDVRLRSSPYDGPSSPPQVPGGGRFFDVPGTPPATRSGAWFWLVMGFLGFLIGQVVGTIFVAIAAGVAGESGELHRFSTMSAPPEWYVGTSLVGLWVGFFMGPWIASRAKGTGRFLADLGVRFRPIDLVGVLIGVGSQFVLDALYSPFINHLKDFTAPTTKLVGASHGWGFVAIAVLTVCGAPFFEEILFRGLGLKALARLFTPEGAGPTRRRAVGLSAAVFVDGILFGLAHWELYQFAGLAVFGMLLAVISYKTGRLGMNMVTHASFNLVAMLALVGTSGGVIH